MENMDNLKKSAPKIIYLWLFQIFTLLVLIGIAIAITIILYNLNNRVYRTHHRVAIQEESIKSLQITVRDLIQPQIKKARVLVQVEYLLRLANLHLYVESDVPAGIQLLKIADQAAADLNDPTLFPLRHALANDLAALQAVPKIDLSGLVLKINALSQQAPNLPILPTKISPVENRANFQDKSKQISAWKHAFQTMGNALQQVVIIRRIPQLKEPLLAPEQQAYLILNIQLKLSEAEWAVLHQQPTIYQQSLQQVTTWVRQYFIQNATATESFLKELADLQNAQIKPAIPDISDSTTALENALNSISNPTIKPVGLSMSLS